MIDTARWVCEYPHRFEFDSAVIQDLDHRWLYILVGATRRELLRYAHAVRVPLGPGDVELAALVVDRVQAVYPWARPLVDARGVQRRGELPDASFDWAAALEQWRHGEGVTRCPPACELVLPGMLVGRLCSEVRYEGLGLWYGFPAGTIDMVLDAARTGAPSNHCAQGTCWHLPTRAFEAVLGDSIPQALARARKFYRRSRQGTSLSGVPLEWPVAL